MSSCSVNVNALNETVMELVEKACHQNYFLTQKISLVILQKILQNCGILSIVKIEILKFQNVKIALCDIFPIFNILLPMACYTLTFPYGHNVNNMTMEISRQNFYH